MLFPIFWLIRDETRDLWSSIVATVEAARQESVESADRFLAQCAGQHLDAMMSSKESTERYLQHTDPKLRYAALDLLMRHWQRDQQFADICAKAIKQDVDPGMRALACNGLGIYFENHGDTDTMRLLVEKMGDPSEHVSVRETAYYAFCKIANRLPARALRFAEKGESESGPGDR